MIDYDRIIKLHSVLYDNGVSRELMAGYVFEIEANLLARTRFILGISFDIALDVVDFSRFISSDYKYLISYLSFGKNRKNQFRTR